MSENYETEPVHAPGDGKPGGGKLTRGPVRKHLVDMTVPMIWGLFSVIAFNVADTFFIAQLGTTELAAISFCFPVVFTLLSVSIGLGVGTSSILARVIGEGDKTRVQRLTTDALLLSALIIGLLSVIGWLTIDPLFRAMGAGDELMPHIRAYMEIWYAGQIFLTVPMVGNSAIRADGDSFTPSMIMVVSGVANAILDPLLIFGIGPFPRMEIEGAAVASVIARFGTLLAGLYFLHFTHRMIAWSLPTLPGFMSSAREILHVGLPAAATNGIKPIAIGIITAILAGFGPEAVAGFGVATRIEALSLVVMFALSAVIGPIAGQNHGAGLTDRVRQTIRDACLFCIGWGLVLAVALGLTAPFIAGLFDNNPAVVAYAAEYLRLVPWSFGAYGVMICVVALFNGLGKPLPGAVLYLSQMFVIYVPLALVAAHYGGVTGVFIAAMLANIIPGIAAWVWYVRAYPRVRAASPAA